MRTFVAFVLFSSLALAEPPRFPLPSNAEAWKALPNPPLPAWARAVSASLPKTAAKMLELDDLHRASSPLGNALAAKLRWAASDAVGSRYGKAVAEFDAKVAGVSKSDLEAWTKSEDPLVPFARKMALAADSITDSEFKALRELHGPETMVGVVHALAYAGFHDRVLLALGVEPEKEPVPALGRTFDAKWYDAIVTPARDPMPERKAVPAPAAATFDWKDLTGKKMPDELATQRKRPLRVPLPPEDKLAFMTEAGRARTKKIVWSHVSQGYQPKMTGAWFAAMNQMQAEAKIDQVFTNTLFWLATRTNRCFY
jgi:hypothetical protein